MDCVETWQHEKVEMTEISKMLLETTATIGPGAADKSSTGSGIVATTKLSTAGTTRRLLDDMSSFDVHSPTARGVHRKAVKNEAI